jgi:hypothetical protein
MAAGGMAVVGIPFYKNMSEHWTLTILGANKFTISTGALFVL